MKIKNVFALTALIFFNGLVFAQNQNADEIDLNLETAENVLTQNEKKSVVNWFTKEPEFSLEVLARANNYHNFTLYTLGMAFTGQMDMKELSVAAGIDFSFKEFNATVQTIYAPTFWDIFNAGIIFINHFNWYQDVYFEMDIMPGLYFSYQPFVWFKTNLTALFQYKLTYIYALKNEIKPTMESHCPAVSIGLEFFPLDWMSISVSVSSYKFYRYYLFFSPLIHVDVGFKANDHLSINVAGEAQFVDFFTLSANFNSLTATVSAKWRF